MVKDEWKWPGACNCSTGTPEAARVLGVGDAFVAPLLLQQCYHLPEDVGHEALAFVADRRLGAIIALSKVANENGGGRRRPPPASSSQPG